MQKKELKSLPSILRELLLILACAGTSLFIHNWDVAHRRNSNLVFNKNFLTQIASQAENLSKQFRHSDTPNPILQAISALTATPEPRAFKIQKWIPEGPEIPSPIELKFNVITETAPQGGKQIYLQLDKVIFLESREGVSIKIPLIQPNFLGLHSKFYSDILLALFFITLTITVHIPMFSIRYKRMALSITEAIGSWKESLKSLLEAVKSETVTIQEINSISTRFNETTSSLSDKIKTDLVQIKNSRTALQDSEKKAAQSELILMNLLIQAKSLDINKTDIVRNIENLFNKSYQARKSSQFGIKQIARVEMNLEPSLQELVRINDQSKLALIRSKELEINSKATIESLREMIQT